MRLVLSLSLSLPLSLFLSALLIIVLCRSALFRSVPSPLFTRILVFSIPLALRTLFASLAWYADNIKCNFAQRILRGYSDPDGVSRSTFSVLATFVECTCTWLCHFCFRQRFRFFVGQYRKIFVASLPRRSRSRAIFEAGRCFEDFSSAPPPMSIEIFERVTASSCFWILGYRKVAFFFNCETTNDRRISKRREHRKKFLII